MTATVVDRSRDVGAVVGSISWDVPGLVRVNEAGKNTISKASGVRAHFQQHLPRPCKNRKSGAPTGVVVSARSSPGNPSIVNSDLYWAPVQSETEGDYICAILNAPITTELARPLMSYGKDERHIHKHVWELPIEKFDHGNDIHKRIAALGVALEKLASSFKIDESLHFAATRRHIRDVVMNSANGRELNELVSSMLE